MLTTEQKKVLDCIDQDFVVKFAIFLAELIRGQGKTEGADQRASTL
jgi:hypothetical protein